MNAVRLAAQVPVLTTERLVLREPRESDLGAMASFMSSERSGWVGGPADRQGAWRALLTGIGHWILRGYGYWTVEDRASGAVAGRVGVVFHAVDWPEPELGWHIYDGFEGRGLGEEAARAARSGAARHMGLTRLISLIAPDNRRSQRLADRLGALVEGRATLFGKPALIYRHPAEAA